MRKKKPKDSTNQLFTIFENLNEVAYISDPRTYKVLYANQVVRKISGNVIGQKCFKAFQGFDRPCPFCTNKKLFNGKKIGSHIWEFQNLRNKRWYRCIDMVLPWHDGRPVRCEIAIDITQQKEASRELSATQERYRKLAESAQDLIFIVDKNLRVEYANIFAAELLGCRPSEITGKHIDRIFPPSAFTLQKERLFHVLKSGKAFSFEDNLQFKGRRIWLDTKLIPINGTPGEITAVMGIARDITDRKNTENKLMASNKKLKQLALRDPLTSLFNHRYLNEIIEAEFYRARRYSYPLSVIMIDVDYFKSINDVYGHKFGDLVLRQLAEKLKKMVRRYDTIVRYGGEEFVIVSPVIDKLNTIVFAQRILDTISLVDFGNRAHNVKLKLSIAVVSFPEDVVIKGMDLVEVAEQILNKAKDSGGNKVYSSESSRLIVAGAGHNMNNINFLKSKIVKITRDVNQGLMESIFAFAKTIEVKDHYTGEHVERTVHYATEIAKALELPGEEVERVKQASMLHDLGKIGISEKILLKNSRLTRKEFEVIKKHPQIGVDIIRPVHFLHPIIPFVLHHHERWDGKGYPYGLKEETIPLGARIVAIADVYQALISDRPYRRAYTPAQALEIIQSESGVLFEPGIVDIFVKILQQEGTKR